MSWIQMEGRRIQDDFHPLTCVQALLLFNLLTFKCIYDGSGRLYCTVNNLEQGMP